MPYVYAEPSIHSSCLFLEMVNLSNLELPSFLVVGLNFNAAAAAAAFLAHCPLRCGYLGSEQRSMSKGDERGSPETLTKKKQVSQKTLIKTLLPREQINIIGE